jgi:hypothetical protein
LLIAFLNESLTEDSA